MLRLCSTQKIKEVRSQRTSVQVKVSICGRASRCDVALLSKYSYADEQEVLGVLQWASYELA
jgi:hypothetical protein